MLFEDRNRLVYQSLKLIVAGILAILLELADQPVVISAGLLQEKSVKVRPGRGPQFLFELLRLGALVSTLAICGCAIL